MADGLSVASSLVALAGFAFQTSKSLYQAIESFKTTKRTVRELRNEVESISEVLMGLQEVAANYEAQLADLKLPLLRCGKSCKEFEEVIENLVPYSTGRRTSFRDWAKLQYKGEDITYLKTSLAGYKATISIALGGATFRQAAVTASVLDEYKEMISETTSDLQDHLLEIDDKLKSLQQQASTQHVHVDLLEIKEERASTEKCLKICAEVSRIVDGFDQRLPQNPSASRNLSFESLPQDYKGTQPAETVTGAMFADFKTKLAMNSLSFENRLKELDQRLRELSHPISELSAVDIDRFHLIKEERDSISRCLDICEGAAQLADKARTNEYENVTSADDSHQMVVSTIGDLICARSISTGSRSIQWLGQMSDETIQKLSADQRSRDPKIEESKSIPESDGFQRRYGAGYQILQNISEGPGSSGVSSPVSDTHRRQRDRPLSAAPVKAKDSA